MMKINSAEIGMMVRVGGVNGFGRKNRLDAADEWMN